MNKLNLKNALYCWSRFIGYSVLYELIFVLAIAASIIITTAITEKDYIAILLNNMLNPDNLLTNFGVLFVFIILLSAIVVNFFVIKLSLSKVFFKEYKNFAITPILKKLPHKITFLILSINFFTTTILALSFEEQYFISRFGHYIFNYTIDFFIVKYIIERYTVISNNKIKTELIH